MYTGCNPLCSEQLRLGCWNFTTNLCALASSIKPEVTQQVPCRLQYLCRVYLIGGAEATGNSNDTALVYTPAHREDYDDQGAFMWIWNMTLPLHFVSRGPKDPHEGKQNFTHSLRSFAPAHKPPCHPLSKLCLSHV